MTIAHKARSASIANQQGQSLVSHCLLVGLLSSQIVEECYGRTALTQPGSKDAAKLRQLKSISRVSGFLHDIGKLDVAFQAHLRSLLGADTESAEDGVHIDVPPTPGGFSFQTYPRHEELSWLLLNRLFVKDKLQAKFLDESGTNASASNSRFAMVEYGIYWHHAKPLREAGSQEESFGSSERIARRLDESGSTWLDTTAVSALVEFCNELDDRLVTLGLASGKELSACLRNDHDLNLSDIKTPAFKSSYTRAEALRRTDDVKSAVLNEMSRTLIRSAIVTADRVVSKLSATELESHIDARTLPDYESESAAGLDTLYAQISAMTRSFDLKFPGPRTEVQALTAVLLAEDSHRPVADTSNAICLQGPAGCGKSKIALQYLLKLSQLQGRLRRVFIFVPRTAIGESLFHELVSEYGITSRVEFLSGGRKLISLGQGIQETPVHLEGTGNVVITTIDQICKTMLSHQKVDLVTQMAHSHVIFDEFHELFEIPAIVLLFQELMAIRQYCAAGTLLVSATPNPQFLKLLGVTRVRKVETFNKQLLTLSLHRWAPSAYAPGAEHPFASPALALFAGNFVVCNTATLAQQASVAHAMAGRDVICLHSKFTPFDKSKILESILEIYGKNSGEMPGSERILISGPIVQASLNITTSAMHTEACHAENMLQRLGRVNRFALLTMADMHVYFALAAGGATLTLANSRQLSDMHQKARTLAFLKFLAKKMPGVLNDQITGTTKVLSLAGIYDWYTEFHTTSEAQSAYSQDYAEVVVASAQVFLYNSFDPIQFPAALLAKAKKVAPGSRLARTSLRDRSYFVLPMRALVSVAGGAARIGLLWNHESEANCVMTDELRHTQRSDVPCGAYLEWTRSADKQKIVSALVGSTADSVFLKQIAKKTTATVKKWDQLRQRALHRDTPIVVCREDFNDNNLYYLDVLDTKGTRVPIGLAVAGTFEKVRNFNFRSRF